MPAIYSAIALDPVRFVVFFILSATNIQFFLVAFHEKTFTEKKHKIISPSFVSPRPPCVSLLWDINLHVIHCSISMALNLKV